MVERRFPCVTAGSTAPGVHRGSGSRPWSREEQCAGMVPVTRRGAWTRSRGWPEEFPAGLVAAPATAADELDGLVRADKAAEEQEQRPSATVTAARQARRWGGSTGAA